MMAAAASSALLILLYQTTRRDILEENDLYCPRSKHLAVLRQLAGVHALLEVNYVGKVVKTSSLLRVRSEPTRAHQ